MTGLIYFKDGEVVVESGNVKAYAMNNELFLETGPGHNLWALESEVVDYCDQLWELPKGNCLEIGLGLGIASRCIMSYPGIKSLTTIEKNEHVIAIQEQLGTILDDGSRDDKWLKYDSDKHRIVNCDGLIYLYQTKRKYDFVFIDFYKNIDEETLPEIQDMVNAAKKVLTEEGTILCWFDKYTPHEFVEPFFALFGKSYIPKRALLEKARG